MRRRSGSSSFCRSHQPSTPRCRTASCSVGASDQSSCINMPAHEPGCRLQQAQGRDSKRGPHWPVQGCIWIHFLGSTEGELSIGRAHLGSGQRARLFIIDKSGLLASAWRAAWPVEHPLSPGLRADGPHHVASALLLEDGGISPQLSLHRQPRLAKTTLQSGPLCLPAVSVPAALRCC